MLAGRDYLSKIDDNGVSVYSHITDVLARILAGKPRPTVGSWLSIDPRTQAKKSASRAQGQHPQA